MPAEYGAIMTAIKNHTMLSVISQLMNLLLPHTTRATIATTNGVTAVATRA